MIHPTHPASPQPASEPSWHFRKAIWAIDAFEPHQKFYRNAARLVKALIDRTGMQVEPVYVLSAAGLRLAEEKVGPWISNYLPVAEQSLKNTLAPFQLGEKLEEPHVLLQKSSSGGEAIDLLCRHALAQKADLILVNSHGRRGLSRWIMGSFAEALLLRAQLPVMVIGQHVRKFHPLTQILFPTEFGAHSLFFFRKVVALARELQVKLLLFHAVPHPIEPIVQSGVYLLGGGWVPVPTYFEREIARQTRRARAWASWASQQGVPTEPIIHTTGGEISEAIVSKSKKEKISFIVMEAQTGPILTTLIGSITRQVIRNAHCPVLVFRFHKKEELEKSEGLAIAAS